MQLSDSTTNNSCPSPGVALLRKYRISAGLIARATGYNERTVRRCLGIEPCDHVSDHAVRVIRDKAQELLSCFDLDAQPEDLWNEDKAA